jgi:hypothetical protein
VLTRSGADPDRTVHRKVKTVALKAFATIKQPEPILRAQDAAGKTEIKESNRV